MATYNKKRRYKSNKREFSKSLLIQESVLIWIETISMIILAFISVNRGSYAELPWLTAMVSLPWTAYGVSQAFYYKKSEKENTSGGIKYETVMTELKLDEPFVANTNQVIDISDDAVG